MISIRPEWVTEIINGHKTVEVRKTRPKLETPFKCYIYCTQKSGQGCTNMWVKPINSRLRSYEALGKVVAEFTCDEIFDMWPGYIGNRGDDMLTFEEREEYLGERGHGYGWHISDVKIYDKPEIIKNFLQKPCDFAASCGACVHSRWSEENYHEFVGCSFELKRPPQSWCYVEER